MRRSMKCLCLIGVLMLAVLFAGCAGTPETSGTSSAPENTRSSAEIEKTDTTETGIIKEQVLESDEGTIHYSYYLPEDYDPNGSYPMMAVMPGYDMMWFGEDSSGANLEWSGFRTWTEQDEDMIVVSAQLEDWGEPSARQAIALTEYFINHFAVDTTRVYAAGYSAGGETMSQAVAMRPDHYAAYLHGVSQWDGDYLPVTENQVAVFIYMAEGDEYYGSDHAQEAYDRLRANYVSQGLSDAEIDDLLQLRLPDADYFAARGITDNYHGAANIVFDDQEVLDWILAHHK